MNDKDKAAFEVWAKSSPTYKVVVENGAFNAFCFEAFKGGLSHRDEQVKGLVGALEKSVEVFEAIEGVIVADMEVFCQIMDTLEKGKAALKAYKESGK